MHRNLLAVIAAGLLIAGCSEEIVEDNARLGGTCLACHEGITDVHPFFALSCADCHGGNDEIEIPAGVVNVRDQALMRASHVLPEKAQDWWANGIDDNEDGNVDEPGEFFDPRLEKEGILVGNLDQEMNKDLNYLRFLNPGDLRVAQVGCGRRSPEANDAMVCHAEVVYDVRRSMMAVNSGVPTGAEYGNAQDVLASAYGDAFAGSEAGPAL